MSGGELEAVFRRQVDAFNAHDLEAFLDTYAEDAIVHGVRPGAPLSGREEMRAHYTVRLADPTIHCEALETLEWPNGWLLVREQITGAGGVSNITAMFEIADGAIARSFIGV